MQNCGGGGRGAVAEPLEGRVLLSVSIVKDLEATPKGTFDDDSQPLAALGSAVYFDLGNELWKSDGTAAGTVQVKSLGSMFPLSAERVGSLLYFPATDNNGNWQLWKSDGTAAGTTKVTDLPPIDPALDYANFTAAGSTLFFTGSDDASTGQYTLFKSDGTAAGTLPLMSFTKTTTQAFDDLGMVAINGKLIFTAPNATNVQQLWASDGTVAGTVALGSYAPMNVVVVGNQVFFDTIGANSTLLTLWKTDGTSAGTVSIASVPNGTSTFPNPALSALVAVGGGVYFQYPNLNQLWHSDGTSAGTIQIATVTPDGYSDTPTIADVGGTAFIVENKFHELWKSNGTAAGTVMLKSFTGAIGELADLNGKLVFAADDGTHGSELWTSDGTATGTTLLKDINPGAGASSPAQFSVVVSKLFFTAFDPVAGRELWTSDGTSTGTTLTVDLTPGTQPFEFGGQQVAVGNTLFFTGQPFRADAGLYRSDGTSAGTFQLSAGNVIAIASDGTTVYFTVNSLTGATGTTTLWKTDGTATGTVSISGITGEDHLVVVGGRAFYSFSGALYVAGPSAGTPLKLATGTIDEMAAFDGQLYYVVETTLTTSPFTTAYALWKTDGTVAGTSKVVTFSGALDQLLPVGSSLYFEADDGTHAGLWVSDGTAAGTQFLSSVTPEFTIGPAPHTAVLNGRLIFPGLDTNGLAPELWVTDGTAAGTQLVSSLATPAGDPLSPQELTSVGGAVYFVAADAITGTWQLWKTDGTAAGTGVILPQIGDTMTSDIPSIAAFDGALYFAGNLDPAVGPELYTADGGGITLLADIVPGAAGSLPDQLFGIDQTLFFTADDGIHGRELWQFSQPAQSLFGRVFNDANNDAFQQPAEHGLAGVTVYLDTNNNGTLDPGEVHVTTDANGNYTFSNVSPGTYTVRQVLPAGWARTEPLMPLTTVTIAANRASPGPVFGDVQISTVPMNFNYLLTLAQHYGGPGTFATGDLNGDDQVNFQDLLILAQNYGHTLPGSAALPTTLLASSPDDPLDSLHAKARRVTHLL